jgi:hypothetical protein
MRYLLKTVRTSPGDHAWDVPPLVVQLLHISVAMEQSSPATLPRTSIVSGWVRRACSFGANMFLLPCSYSGNVSVVFSPV